MSPIANRSRWQLRYPFLAGIVLLTGMSFSSSTAAQHQSPEPQAQAHQNSSRIQSRIHWFQFGKASWYGNQFQGQPTANGESFDMNQMTCAHRSLPLGALIRVTNLRNHRSVVVRVNDRGPMITSRVVDLSYAAARLLGFRGLAPVRIDMINPSPTPAEVAHLTWPEIQR